MRLLEQAVGLAPLGAHTFIAPEDGQTADALLLSAQVWAQSREVMA